LAVGFGRAEGTDMRRTLVRHAQSLNVEIRMTKEIRSTNGKWASGRMTDHWTF
jgi:hypothetical protein